MSNYFKQFVKGEVENLQEAQKRLDEFEQQLKRLSEIRATAFIDSQLIEMYRMLQDCKKDCEIELRKELETLEKLNDDEK